MRTWNPIGLTMRTSPKHYGGRRWVSERFEFPRNEIVISCLVQLFSQKAFAMGPGLREAFAGSSIPHLWGLCRSPKSFCCT